ncbi:MAG TPA: single-stranded DNA-binding protein, partial [Clostridiales bacterium]|nr:single-stranded DNA-binding protein [Clostridiales bacterium]
RTYQKRISEEETITKTAYEVSINRMELVEKEEKEE